MRTGLVSVTFRQLSPAEIVSLSVEAGLDGIEWGGDVHVPAGDVALAREVAALTRNVGLEIASYGSYYRLDGDGFEAVLESAIALSAPNIRIWAGRKGSSEATPEDWETVVADGQRIAALAQQAGIQLSFEFHEGTLADTAPTTLELLRRIDTENVRTYWQPPVGTSFEARLAEIQELGPAISNVHVFHWISEDGKTIHRPLSEGEEEWDAYLRTAQSTYALLEFVANGSEGQFLADAATLRKIL